MNDTRFRREWTAMQARLTAQTGTSFTPAEDQAMFMVFGLGAVMWNRLLMEAGDDEARRLQLKEELAAFVLEMSDRPAGRVM
jgi:hypothetical protein